MQTDDGGLEHRHDSGCRMTMRLPPGVAGDAVFRGERDEHRLMLERRFSDPASAPAIDPRNDFVLWCGLMPSGAEGDVNDLTVVKECTWTRRLGFRRYVKVNAATYRWTDSRTAAAAAGDALLCHPDNLPLIRDLAGRANLIVLATGTPPPALVPHVLRMVAAVQASAPAGMPMLCLGLTKAGWPKHSSRLAYDTPFAEYAPLVEHAP